MKTEMMLKIENNRLRKRNEDLEARIENNNKMYDYHLKSLHAELEILLRMLQNET